MVSQITRQKDNRGDERGNHAAAVRDFVAPLDEDETEREKNRAQTVERGVDGGQIVDAHGSRSSWRTVSTMRGWTFVQSIPSPSVSKIPRKRACLSTATKMVLWTNKSTEDFWGGGATGGAPHLRLGG